MNGNISGLLFVVMVIFRINGEQKIWH